MATFCRILLLGALGLVAFTAGLLLFCYPGLGLVLAGAAFWPRRGRRGASTSHGSAAPCSVAGLTRAGMIGDDHGHSLVMGRASFASPPTRGEAMRQLLSPRVSSDMACRMMLLACRDRPDDSLIRIRDFVSILTIAPSGAGKSVSMLINNLKSYRGSCVIVDPKGELWKATAAHREKVLSHRCIRLDPFGIAGPVATSHGLNPFDFIDPEAADFALRVQNLVNAVVVQDDQQQPHWNAKATELLAAFCYWVCAIEKRPAQRNLACTVDLLSDKELYKAALEDMQKVREFGGVVRQGAARLSWTEGKELGSVASTLFRHLDWLLAPPVAAGLSRSTFDPRWLWDGKTDVYLCIPHDRLQELAGLVRLWLATIMGLVGHSGDEKHPVLFIVDECGHLGHQKSIETAVSLMRSYGVRLWLLFQSLDQIRTCYGDAAQKIIDNCQHKQFFGLNSYDTAEMVSKQIGDATILVESINRNASRSQTAGGGNRESSQGSVSTGWSSTLSEAARRLYKPEEILTLPHDCMLLFAKNLPVIPVRLVRHYADPAFRQGGTGRDRKVGVAAFWLALSYFVFAAGLSGFLLSVTGVLSSPLPTPTVPSVPPTVAVPGGVMPPVFFPPQPFPPSGLPPGRDFRPSGMLAPR